MITPINHETDCKGVPFNHLKELLNFLPYGSAERVMVQMLILTGCRIRSLDRMKTKNLFGEYLYFNEGKSTRGIRKERLPDYYLRELSHYRGNNRVCVNKLFGISSNTLCRYISKIRPKLSPIWQIRRLKEYGTQLQGEYLLQLKGLRKDFQTLEFAKQYEKWHDASVALEFTSKKMRHSSTKITAYHYIENFDGLHIDAYKHRDMADIMKNAAKQKRIIDFC